MSNPYSSVSISNFNVSPPSDDASEVDGNQVEWDKHLTKLATPLKNLAESINTNVASAFGKRFGTTFETKSTNYNIAAPGDQGKFFEVTGATTITLPAAVDAGDGFPVAIINNGSGVVTVDGNASELINGLTSIALDPNDALIITCDASSWVGFIVRADLSIPVTEQMVIKTADLGRSNDTLLADSDLKFTGLIADKNYAFDGVLLVHSASATPGFKWTFVVDAGTITNAGYLTQTQEEGAGYVASNPRADDITATPTLGMNAAKNYWIHIHGHFVNSNSSQLTLSWAQNVTNATDTTLKAGSWLKLSNL